MSAFSTESSCETTALTVFFLHVIDNKGGVKYNKRIQFSDKKKIKKVQHRQYQGRIQDIKLGGGGRT